MNANFKVQAVNAPQLQERVIGRIAIVLFTVLVCSVYGFLWEGVNSPPVGTDPIPRTVLFSYVTFAGPCLAAVLAGAGLYLDAIGDTLWARVGFSLGWLILICVFVYFVVLSPGMTVMVQAKMLHTIVGVATLCSLGVLLFARTPYSVGVLVFHAIAWVALYLWIKAGLPTW